MSQKLNRSLTRLTFHEESHDNVINNLCSLVDIHFPPFVLASLSPQSSDDEGQKEILLWQQRQIQDQEQHANSSSPQPNASP